MVFVLTTAGLTLDYLFGEPKRFHPLVGFGWCANALEKKLNHRADSPMSFVTGLICLLLLVLPLTFAIDFADYQLTSIHPLLSGVFAILLIYLAIGHKSLIAHAENVLSALSCKSVSASQRQVSLLVSRDSANMSETEITRATIESTLENGCDAIFGVLFWFIVGGTPMVVLYRLINTLDAMWGYRNERFELFGKSAAILDDVLNYLPARITALCYSLCGDTKTAFSSWRVHAKQLASPNSGPVMTSGAGSLNIRLGGPASYHGRIIRKPFFGGVNTPQASDILRACKLVQRALLLWCITFCLLTIMDHFISNIEAPL